MQYVAELLHQVENLLALGPVVFEGARVHHQPSGVAVLLCAGSLQHCRMQFIYCGFVWVILHHVVQQFKCPQRCASQLLGCVTRGNPGFVLSGVKTVPPLL